MSTRLRGTPAAPGRARGPLFLAADRASPEQTAAADLDTIRAAAERAATRLEEVASKQRERSPAAADILEAQAMILRDPALEAAVGDLLQTRGAAGAIAEAVGRYARELEALDDPYLKERAADVREAGRLLEAELAGSAGSRLAGLERPSIVLAAELSPADILGVDPALFLAMVTETGGRTSHASIVARELGIPAVVGVADALRAAAEAPAAEVDGDAGELTLLDEAAEAAAARRPPRLSVARAPVRLMANVGSATAARAAADRGAAGVGLFRTEFLFLGASETPSAEEQTRHYAEACQALHPHPVVVRTLDAGSDKALPFLLVPAEPNPALGRRGIRLWLAHRELWEPQVRALVAVAAQYDNLQVMVPMIASTGELDEARSRFEAEARRRKLRVPPLGMMVELPAVATSLQTFAGLVDFVSLGTNDLAQYALGADRELQWEEGLTEFHPGVLGLISQCLNQAAAAGIEAGVCGEMAGIPEGAVFLAGAGATSLSMATSSMTAVLRTLVRLGIARCRELAAAALGAGDAQSARRLLRQARS